MNVLKCQQTLINCSCTKISPDIQKNISALSYRLEDFKKLLLIQKEKPRSKYSKNKADELKRSIFNNNTEISLFIDTQVIND